MAIAFKLIAPIALASTNATGISGTIYAIDANGFLTVTQQGDVVAFLNAGFVPTSWSSGPIGATGLQATPLKLIDACAPAGGSLPAAAASGALGFAISLGASFALTTEAANSNSKADSCLFEYVLPPNYIAGQNITVTIDASITIGSGTLSAKTLALAACRTATAGTQGSNICTTTAQTLTANTPTDYAFTINGSTLNPGDRLILEPTLSLTETGGHNVTAQLNSFRVS